MPKLFDFFPPELQKEFVARNPALQKKFQAPKPLNKVIKSHSYAYPAKKKLPLDTSRQVQSAMSYFDKVAGVNELDKVEAFKKIIEKAEIFKVCTIVFKTKYPSYSTPRGRVE